MGSGRADLTPHILLGLCFRVRFKNLTGFHVAVINQGKDYSPNPRLTRATINFRSFSLVGAAPPVKRSSKPNDACEDHDHVTVGSK
jgi:hypothetical protein